MAPPQVTARAERAIRSLSRDEIAALLYDSTGAPLTAQLVLKELRRRFWQARMEESDAGVRCSIPHGC